MRVTAPFKPRGSSRGGGRIRVMLEAGELEEEGEESTS